MHDVVVVGGGPVGLAAAIDARMHGLTVLVIEPRTGPVDKACGEGLMPGALPLLRRLGVTAVGRPLRGVQYGQGASAVIHRFTSGEGVGMRRTALHDALAARAAELGVETMTGRVDELVQAHDSVRARVQVRGADVATTVEARWLLGCDGLHSAIARYAGLAEGEPARPGPRARGRFGIREHYAVPPWSDNVEVYFGRRAEFYITPVSANEVGLAMLARRGVDFDAALAEVPALAARLAGAERSSERRGAGPFGQRTRRRVAGRVLLVGDASGYVDAITGEGLRLGLAQAAAAVTAIAAGRPQAYEAAWRRATRDFRRLTSALVRAAGGPLRPLIVPTAVRAPWLFGRVVERLAR